MDICAGHTSPLQVVQAYAGTGEAHVAMCLVRKLLQINRLDDTNGASSGQSELVPCGTRSMHSLLRVVYMREVGDLLIAGAKPTQLTSAQLAEYVDATTKLRDLVLERIDGEREHMGAVLRCLHRGATRAHVGHKGVLGHYICLPQCLGRTYRTDLQAVVSERGTFEAP